MLSFFIRNFFVLIVAIYTFYKLLNISSPCKQTLLLYLFFSFFVSIFSALCFITIPSINWLLIMLLFILGIKFITKLPLSITYITSLFSFTLGYISFSFSTLITALFFSFFYYENYQISWIVVRIFIGITQIIIIYSCFHIPRLKKGMSFLFHIPLSNIGSFLSFFLIMLFITFSQAQTKFESLASSFVLLIFILSFLLFYWWNYHITQTYKKYLKKNEIDSLTLLLEEKNQEIIYLRSENDKLARIIHKDNKLIPALSMAILDSYENNTKSDLSKLDSDSSLHMKLKQLYEERIETLENYQKETEQLPQTSYASVNAVLSYMKTEALKHKISYQVMLFDDLTSTIPDKISENDFVHMLSDLLANAINACKDTDFGILQIFLGEIDGISTIKIYNNGNVFDMETLKNFGQIRHTTHADTGGLGIGLMDIWMLKEKYKLTLLIDEITDSPSVTYTCINVLFNHKNHYIIQSDRHKKLSTNIIRPDIMILSKE